MFWPHEGILYCTPTLLNSNTMRRDWWPLEFMCHHFNLVWVCVLLRASACRGPEHPGAWTQTGLPWSVDQAQGLLPQGARVHTGAPVVPSVSGQFQRDLIMMINNPSRRRSENVKWHSFTSCFPTSLQTLEQEEKDNEAVSKMMALDQKNQLLNLFHEKNRPTLAKWPPVGFQ